MPPAPKDGGVTTRAQGQDNDNGKTKVSAPINHAREHTGTKRTRETSLEPTPNPVSTPLVTKKNRLESTTEDQDQDPSPDSSPEVDQDQDQSPEQKEELPSRDLSTSTASASGSGSKEKEKKETGNVGEVRRKVQEMNWKEGQAPLEGAEPAIVAEDGEPVKEKELVEEGRDLKRKSLDRNESSILEPLSPTKRAKETPSPPPEKESAPAEIPAPTPAPAPAAVKKQSTFSSFSSSSSPFASSSSASPFASTSKPLSTGSAFGNYSSTSSPFARKPVPAPATTKLDSTEDDRDKKVDSAATGTGAEETEEKIIKGSSFGDILKESKADEDDGSEKVQMTEKDVHTGEEGEETVYQCRAKLYVMQSDGGWKERGVGALKLNVKSVDGKSPRLVMRAEGVLRLMLNVSLYVGMTLIEDGKHVRSTVFEDGERRLVTFRLGSQKAASELMANIQDHIPLESDKGSEV